MKKTLLFSLMILYAASAYSQNAPKISFNIAKKLAKAENADKKIALLVKGDPDIVKKLVEQHNGTFKYSRSNISSVSIAVKDILFLMEDPRIIRIEEGAPLLKPLMDDTMRYMNQIIQIHNGNMPLTRPYTGKNVVLGIIDTGIDYAHPDFRDSTGKTRIKFIWDHLLPDSTNSPLPYNYGQEFNETDINAGTIPGTQNSAFHGTAISGAAAGNGLAVGEYIGAAPDADIIEVSLNFNVSDSQFLSSVADAVDYIYTKANAMGKPCIINISAGTYYGSHDGKDLSTQMIDNLITAQNGRSLVCAAGNAGSFPLHVKSSVIPGDTAFTWASSTSTQAYFEFWADSMSMQNISYTIVADKATGIYEYRGELPYTNIQQQLGVLHSDTLYSVDGNRLAVINSYGDKVGDQYGMYYDIEQDTLYNWRIQMVGNGSIDAYSFNWVPTASVPSSIFYAPLDFYRYTDFEQNLCSGFQCSDKTITVAQYTNMNRYRDYNNVLQTFPTTVGALHPTSSKGPTRDGRQKPDIAASSEWIFGPLIVSQQSFWTQTPSLAIKIPPTAQHVRTNGTSTASAVVSGIVALYLEKYPFASWLDIKNAVKNCSITDTYTGNSLPNINWGYGKIDAFSMLTNCGITAIEKNERSTIYIYCSPNPSAGDVKLSFPVLKSAGTLVITDAEGRLNRKIEIEAGIKEYKLIKVNDLVPGIYFIKLFSGKEIVAVGKLLHQ